MTHKYKVGDKVRVTRYGLVRKEGVVISLEVGGYMIGSRQGIDNHHCSDDDFNLYFYHLDVEPANTLTLNTTYTAMNGTKWTCIHVRDNGNAVLDNGISSAEYTSEGWRVDGDSRYDVRWKDEVEEVTWRCSRSGKGLPQYNTLFDVTLNLINGQPDWSSAKVEGV